MKTLGHEINNSDNRCVAVWQTKQLDKMLIVEISLKKKNSKVGYGGDWWDVLL